MAWKLNSKQLLSKTLNSRMNIIETRAVLNIVNKAKQEDPEIIRKIQCRKSLFIKTEFYDEYKEI